MKAILIKRLDTEQTNTKIDQIPPRTSFIFVPEMGGLMFPLFGPPSERLAAATTGQTQLNDDEVSEITISSKLAQKMLAYVKAREEVLAEL